MTRLRSASGVLVFVMGALVHLAPAAQAHGTEANYRSVVHGLTPAVPGLTLTVVKRDQFLQITNRSGSDVLVYGYEKEPYIRLLSHGTVQVNHNSPAYYLNMDSYGTSPVPATASATAAPDWVTDNTAGRYRWHDHREHWMGSGTPPAVKDEAKKWTVQNYTIALKVGERDVTATGTLYWLPVKKSIAFEAMLALLGIGALGLGLARRRRGGGDGGAEPAVEAW